MSYYLFLDDERLPGDVTWIVLPVASFQIVRNYDEFVKVVENQGIPVYVTFDHDLADEHYVAMLEENSQCVHKNAPNYGTEKTGFECAKWLVDYCANNVLKFPEFAVHSMNPIGKERIINYIASAKKHLGI